MVQAEPHAEDRRRIEAALREAGLELVSVSAPRDSAAVEPLYERIIQSIEDFYRDVHRERTQRGIEFRRRRLQGK